MTQCKATTKKGDQCKRSIKNESEGSCSIHSKQRAPRRVPWNKFARVGSQTIFAIAAINDVYQFAEKHWPHIKTAYKIVKELLIAAMMARKSSSRSGGGISRRKVKIERTMVDLQRDCKRAIRRGYVLDEEASDIHADFNLWFSQLPPNVRRAIYRRILAQKFAVASTTESGKSAKNRKVRHFVIGRKQRA